MLFMGVMAYLPPYGESYFVHINRELCKPLPGIFLLDHTGNM